MLYNILTREEIKDQTYMRNMVDMIVEQWQESHDKDGKLLVKNVVYADKRYKGLFDKKTINMWLSIVTEVESMGFKCINDDYGNVTIYYLPECGDVNAL